MATEIEEQSLSSGNREQQDQQQLLQQQQEQQALASLMSYLENDCPEMALFGVFIDKFECDESSNNVRIWFKNGNYYEGAFIGGTMDGVGRYQWSHGLSYHGTFQKNSLEGFGAFNWPDGSSYEGDVKEGLCHGNGLLRLPNGQFYNGQWVNGRKEGMGTMSYDANGHECYSGEWAKERRHGFGYYHYAPSSQAQYVGYWSNGCRHGAGSAVWPEQRQVYSGYWDRGIQQGVGRHVWASDRATPAQYQLQNSYVGDWSSGQRHGKGSFHYAGGASYSGDWVDDIKHGEGKVTFKNGQSYDGQFVEDRLVGGPGYVDISRTPDPRLFERQLSRKVDNDETLSAFLLSCIPAVLTHPHFNVERGDGTLVGPSENAAESGQTAINNCCTVLLRFASELRRVFAFYCDLGLAHDDQQQSAATAFGSRSLMRVLWWRLIKDARIPFSNIGIESVADLDRRLAVVFSNRTQQQAHADVHDVRYSILFGDFLLWLLATALLTEGYGRPGYLNQDAPLPGASVCLERFLTEYILPNCCIVQGRLFASHDNAMTTLRGLTNLVQLYKTIADIKMCCDHDKTISGRQLVAVIVASGISTATPAVKALAGNVFLSSESDCTAYAFGELTPLEVGEALAEVAEFVNESLGGATDMVVRVSTSVIGGDDAGSSAPVASANAPAAHGGVAEQSPTILGSILQESSGGAGDGIFMIRAGGHSESGAMPFSGHQMARIDWNNLVAHLLSCPDLADLPRLAMSLRQTTLMTTACGPRALSGLSSSERSATPQARAPTEDN